MGAPKQRPLPTIGSKYEKITNDGKKHLLTVIKAGGKIKYQIGKEVFGSPSAAGKYIKGSEVNGWKYWGIEE